MSLFKKDPDELYADLILANLSKETKSDYATIISPKLLTGITHRLGGEKDWKGLEQIATFPDKENPIPEFQAIFAKYGKHRYSSDIDTLILNLFQKAGWRNRKKAGLIVEQTPRNIDKETILGVIKTKGIYLETLYVYLGKDFYQVVSYCPFSISDKKCKSGAAYLARVSGDYTSPELQEIVITMLKKENHI